MGRGTGTGTTTTLPSFFFFLSRNRHLVRVVTFLFWQVSSDFVIFPSPNLSVLWPCGMGARKAMPASHSKHVDERTCCGCVCFLA